jgi:hypothetical protein
MAELGENVSKPLEVYKALDSFPVPGHPSSSTHSVNTKLREQTQAYPVYHILKQTVARELLICLYQVPYHAIPYHTIYQLTHLCIQVAHQPTNQPTDKTNSKATKARCRLEDQEPPCLPRSSRNTKKMGIRTTRTAWTPRLRSGINYPGGGRTGTRF